MKSITLSSTTQSLPTTPKRRTKQYNFDILAEEYYKILEKRKKIQEQEEQLKERLETYVSGGLKAYSGKKFILSSYERKGAVDYNAIPVLKGIDLEKFRKDPVICWKVTKI